MKKVYFPLLLSMLLLANKILAQQCDQMTITGIPSGRPGVQVCISQCENGLIATIPPNGTFQLPPLGTTPPITIGVGETELSVTFPNSSNTIDLPLITGFVIQRTTSGIFVSYPATLKQITLSTNMMVDIKVNGSKSNPDNTMTPSSKSLSIPKGAKISIRKDAAKIEIMVTGEQITYNSTVRTPVKNKVN